jgi:hypothetical protein
MTTNAPKKEPKTKVTADNITPPPKKSQKVKIFVSVFRVNDKIISALGVPTVDAPVTHKFLKKKLRNEDLFILASQIKSHQPYSNLEATKKVVEQALNNKVDEIVLPELRANKLQNIGIFVHEILNIEIELLS